MKKIISLVIVLFLYRKLALEHAEMKERVKELEGIRFDLEQDALLFPTMAEYENVKDDNERLTRQLAEAQGRIEKLEGENAVLKSLLPPNEYATYFG